MFEFKEFPPLSLYIHFPWCVRKCPYCDFNSHETGNSPFPEADYIDALIRDLEFELPHLQGRPVMSIFLGGGTPSLLSAPGAERLLATLRSRLTIHTAIEITLEANPGAADQERFNRYRAIGVNRLSLGIQSFADDKLQRLGRIHNREDALSAVAMARGAGFDNVNLDLMYGLPGQTLEQAVSDLRLAIAQKPNHISWYQLTIEPNTLFYKKRPALPAEDLIWAMQQQGQAMLAASGYRQYEVSAYSLPSHRSVHNLNYWRFGDYLGIGAGAHSKVTDISQGTITRYARHRIPERYIKQAGKPDVVVKKQLLEISDVKLEFMMDALRMTEGFPPPLFTQRTGLPISVIAKQLAEAEGKGLLERNGKRIKATKRGMQYLNDLLQIF